MKIDQLVYFLEASRHNHIRKAARALAISPSAISHGISALEDELGFKLFQKTGKRLALTREGKILTERGLKALQEIQNIKTDLTSGKHELQGHYRIGGTHWLASAFIAPHWMELSRRFPRLSVELLSLRSAECLARVAEGELDFAVCLSPLYHPHVESTELFTSRMLLMVRRGHPVLRLPVARRTRALQHFPFTAAKERPGVEGCGVSKLLAEMQIPTKPVLYYDSYDVALTWLETSNAWSLLPDFLMKANRDRFRPIFPKRIDGNPVKVAAIWPKARTLAQPISLLLESLRGLS